MTRQEFTDRLAARLAESLPPSAVRSQVRYYEGYIDAEIRNGKTEEEATAGLGDPVLIARSILESPHSEADFTVSDGDAYEEGSYQGANQPGESGAGDALTDTTPGGTENGSGREAAERGRTETAGDSRAETAGSRHEAEDSRTETVGSRAETADRRKETDSRTKPERNRVFRDDSGRPDHGDRAGCHCGRVARPHRSRSSRSGDSGASADPGLAAGLVHVFRKTPVVRPRRRVH